ncbi:MAG TPA: hypothetical protein VKX17_23945 [Planctomycetota bacterium]|nr:hypothetical protein [Planctomycetota bacterium]
MFSSSDSESLLRKAIDDLKRQWLNSADSWKDKARDDFEKEHLEPLLNAAENAARAMRNLDGLMREVVRDCR